MAKRYASLFLGNLAEQEAAPPPAPPVAAYRVLLVDDDVNLLAALRRVFRWENYELLFAHSAEEALRLLEAGPPIQLIISDFMMPGMSGSELLSRVRERWPDIIRIMLTGHADTDAVMGSVKDGAVYRFILKPWNDDDLRLSTALALEQYELLQRNRMLERENRKQQSELDVLAKPTGVSRSQLAIVLHKKGLLSAQQVQLLHREIQAGKTTVMQQLMQHDWLGAQKLHELLRKDLMLEEIHLRVLERQPAAQSLEGLGLSPHNFKRLLHGVNKPQGIILVTGPTGSGKTTTLFALLQHEASSAKNYVTIEDPVEFHVDMAGQVPVRERIGLSFASILRQDPDVILLGEIRDQETAEVAFHVAPTGHLVFSTLHASSAAATVARLQELGLKPCILASALEAIIAQRLVHRICSHCRERVTPDPQVLKSLGKGSLAPGLEYYHGRGCQHCSKGYKGRIGIHEVLTMSDALRDAISAGASATQLLAVARHGHAARRRPRKAAPGSDHGGRSPACARASGDFRMKVYCRNRGAGAQCGLPAPCEGRPDMGRIWQ